MFERLICKDRGERTEFDITYKSASKASDKNFDDDKILDYRKYYDAST